MSIKSKIQAIKDIVHMKLIKKNMKFDVLSIEDTVNLIVSDKLSVSRYGDGEVFMMANQMNESFQTYNKVIAQKLKNIIINPIDNHITCIPDIFDDLSKYNDLAMNWYSKFLSRKKYLWYKYFDLNRVYGNSLFTRCYMDLVDKAPCNNYFELLRKIWQDRDIVFIEGEFSRLGYGNDLFDGSKSIRRILAPAVNAYERYDEILREVKRLNKDCLILIALGATATCLAYDLAKNGYQAIDLGHVDIEYEWMKMGANEKVPIPSKYVNEAGKHGRKEEILNDNSYQQQIIAKIGTKY